MRRILWVFAHQDDELAAAARILEQRRRGDVIWCAYLTDGALKVAATVRNQECLAALRELGVRDDHVLFGTAPDGQLVDHLDDALAFLETAGRFDEVGTLAWEGGHHDHDAAHLVAMALATRQQIEAFEVPLYNGVHAPGPLFRVMAPIGDGWMAARISLRDAWRVAALVRHYKSQRRTWLGLFPEAAFRLLVLRTVHVRRADARRVQQAPHEGVLFYERRFGCSRERFERAAGPFRAVALPPHS